MSTLLLLAALASSVATPLGVQLPLRATVPVTGVLRSRAESTYTAGDRLASARAYEALLLNAPNDSRALFRLAGLRTDRGTRVSLLQRYVALEPDDAWGWLALSDALFRDELPSQAAAALSHAERIAPREHDVVLGRARALQRVGLTDASISRFEELARSETADADTWHELAEQRWIAGRAREGIDALVQAQMRGPTLRRAKQLRRWKREAGAHFEPAFGLTRDSDANITRRASLAVRLPRVGRSSVSLGASRLSARNTADFVESPTVRAGFVSAQWRPRATLNTHVTLGASDASAARPIATSTTPVQSTILTGLARARWRMAADGLALDVGVSRAQLDATPLLVSNRVVRTEGSVAVDVPLAGGLRARALSRAAALTTLDEPPNGRTVVGASLVRPIRRWGDVSVSGQIIRLGRATRQGYFAPRSAQIVELSTFIQHESDGGVVFALDVGGGMQRVRTFDSDVLNAWQPAARFWTHLDVPLRERAILRTEVDLYDSGVASDAASVTHWRWVSVAVGVRVTP